MPEANNVTQLMHNYSKLVAVLADGNGLRTLAALANKRTTACGWSLSEKN